MSLWNKPGEWKPAASPAATGTKKRSLQEIRIVSFCETHGFTRAKFLRAADAGNTIFLGECGCEILHGKFLSTRNDHSIVEFKVIPPAEH